MLSDMCVFEYPSNQIRENCLKTMEKKKLEDPSGGELKNDRAKTALQIQRNGALRKAVDSLKKNPAYQGKINEIFWKKNDPKDKDREIRVDGSLAFCQTIDDVSGRFIPPFVGTA